MDFFHNLQSICRISHSCCVIFVLGLLINSPAYSAEVPTLENEKQIIKRGQSETAISNQAVQEKFVAGELIVKFRKNVTAARKASIHAAASTQVRSRIPKLNMDLVKALNVKSIKAIKKLYQNNPHVEYVELNGVLQVQLTPDDPRFGEQWSLNNSNDSDIDAIEAWDVETGSQAVIVANIDTGIDYTHEDLVANMWINPGEIPGNGIDDDGNGYIDDIHGWDFINDDNDPMDDNGHGSHTAGITAASGNNGIGVTGISWQSRLIALKAFDEFGTGSFFSAAAAVIYGTDMGATVTNNSYGCLGCSSTALDDAFEYARQAGVLNVVAAGNDTNNNDQQSYYPCNSTNDSVICVAATYDNDIIGNFSNFGQSNVDLAAPGVNILSTVIKQGKPGFSHPSGYLLMSGTSMAAPMVAGSAAVLLSRFPSLPVDDLKYMILGSVDAVSGLSDKTLYGGRLNLNHALNSNFIIKPNNPLTQTILAGQGTSATADFVFLNGYSAGIQLNISTDDPNLIATPDISLASPVNNKLNLTISTLAGVRAGHHRVYITGTADDGSGESHLGVVELTVQTDIAASALLGDAAVETGRPLSVSGTLQNLGQGQAEDFYLSFYLSQDSDITTSDIKIGSYRVDEIAHASSDQFQATVWIPRWNALGYGYPAIAPGTYILGVIVDNKLLIPDSDTTNNTLAGPQVEISTGIDSPPQWAATYIANYPSFYRANGDKTVVDSSGNVYRGGTRFNGSNYDLFVVKYDDRGNQLWLSTYDNGFDDYFASLAIDNAGNVYPVGYSFNGTDNDGVTLKFDANGNQVWVAIRDYGASEYTDVVLAGSDGKIYTSGIGGGTIAYDSNGTELWSSFNAGGSILEDDAGNIIVLSHSVEKFTPDGVRLWIASLGFFANNLAIDATGNIFASGNTYTGSIRDVIVKKFDGAGNLLWTQAFDNGHDDESRGLATDSQGNLYLLADTFNGIDIDYALVKYDASGARQWTRFYDNGGIDLPAYLGIEVDDSDYIYVAGNSCNYPDWPSCWGNLAGGYGGSDLVSIKYDKDGDVVWISRWDGVLLDGHQGNITVDGEGYLYLSAWEFAERSLITVKYWTPTEQDNNSPPVAEAGDAQSINEYLPVTLTGTGYDFEGPVTHQWTQLTGPLVTLTGEDTDTASFTAPPVESDTVFTFEYTVTDSGGKTDSDVVSITVLDTGLLPPPGNLTAIERKDKNSYFHDLSWTPVTGATEYRIYSADSATGPWLLVDSVNNTDYSRPVDRRDFYYYVVTSVNGQEESEYSNWAASDGSVE